MKATAWCTKSAATPCGCWPWFTLRASGHRSVIEGGGEWEPGIERLIASMRPNVGFEFLLTNKHGVFYGIKSYRLRQHYDYISVFVSLIIDWE